MCVCVCVCVGGGGGGGVILDHAVTIFIKTQHVVALLRQARRKIKQTDEMNQEDNPFSLYLFLFLKQSRHYNQILFLVWATEKSLSNLSLDRNLT